MADFGAFRPLRCLGERVRSTRGRGETRHATWVCAGIVLGFDRLVMLCTAPAADATGGHGPA
jgi:hypothetical protein